MDREQLAKLSRDDLIEQLLLRDERERREKERPTAGKFLITTEWVPGPGGAHVPAVEVANWLKMEVVDSYRRLPGLDYERADGWEGPFVKSVRVEHLISPSACWAVGDEWREEPL